MKGVMTLNYMQTKRVLLKIPYLLIAIIKKMESRLVSR